MEIKPNTEEVIEVAKPTEATVDTEVFDPAAVIVEDDEEKLQVPYTSASDVCTSMDTVVPRSMVYEDGYIELPQFVLDVIEEKKVRRKKGETAQYDFSADEAAQWKGLRDTAELMLSDKDSLTEEELKMWQGALDTANIMLD